MVAALRSPVTFQAIARATRPPSIGNAGNRLKTSSSRLIEASQATIASTPVAPERRLDQRRVAELVPAAGEDAADHQRGEDQRGHRRARQGDPRFHPGPVGFAVHPRHAAEDPELDRADPDPVAGADEGVAELVQEDRAEEAGGAGDGEDERRGRARRVAQQFAVEVGHPEDDQEEDQEPGPVDRDADPANVEQGDGAAAEHRAHGKRVAWPATWPVTQLTHLSRRRIGEPDQAWLRARLEELERIDRPSASEGERRAAEWLVGQFRRARRRGANRGGRRARHLLVAARARHRARRARRIRRRCAARAALGAALGALGAAGIASDFPPHQRRLRAPLPKRTAYNVVCEIGDPDAAQTIVVAPTTTPPTPASSSTRRSRRSPTASG